MNFYNVSIRFNLDREEDRAALSWLSRSKNMGFKTNSDAVIAAINEYCERRERLSADPYLETREKENVFLKQVLDTVRQGMREVFIGNLGGLLTVLQNAVPAQNSSENTGSVDGESLNMAFDFVDSL